MSSIETELSIKPKIENKDRVSMDACAKYFFLHN